MLTAAALSCAPLAAAPDEAERAVQSAHSEIWHRFIDKHGVMLDFTGLNGEVNYPTPEECQMGKPNALGWWTPIENGAMFNGLYMDGAVARWEKSKAAADAAKARRLMEGLLHLNSVSRVKGFVARGVSTDGNSHYPMGSNDQTLPWFAGLWRYWQSGIATPGERERIREHLVRTGDAIIALGWKMPAEPPFHTRGSFDGYHFEEVSRMLFTLKLLHNVTGDPKWGDLYAREIENRDPKGGLTKLDICAGGMKFFYAKTHNWTSCAAAFALRGLWEIETQPRLREAYAAGLVASANLAAESLSLAEMFDPTDNSFFTQDWRASMLPLWVEQKTQEQAVDLAHRQLREFQKSAPRRLLETAFVREPASAAWIVTLCPEPDIVRKHADAIKKLIARYDYTRLYYSTFFWVEGAWWRLADTLP